MRAEICTKQARFTLERLHAELGGKIQDNKKEAERLAQAMKHVEAVLKMLDPSYSVAPIAVRRRKPNSWFKRGTIYRAALDVLRTAEKPLTAREVTWRMLVAKGIMKPDQQTARDLQGAVLASLRGKAGNAVEIVGEGQPAKWRISSKG